MRQEPRVVRIAVGFYRLLVWLYPRAFRRSYGDAMTQLFRDASLDAFRQSGRIGFLGFMIASIADYVPSLVREHWESITIIGSHYKQVISRLMPACWMVLTAISLGLWVGSGNGSVGLFGMGNDTSLRVTKGVMEFRHIYAHSIEAPIAAEHYHEIASRREWFSPPEPTFPGFAFSSGHVLGIGRAAIDGLPPAIVTPAEYWLLRVPLWLLLIPLFVWSVLILNRKRHCRSEQGAGAVIV